MGGCSCAAESTMMGSSPPTRADLPPSSSVDVVAAGWILRRSLKRPSQSKKTQIICVVDLGTDGTGTCKVAWTLTTHAPKVLSSLPHPRPIIPSFFPSFLLSRHARLTIRFQPAFCQSRRVGLGCSHGRARRRLLILSLSTCPFFIYYFYFYFHLGPGASFLGLSFFVCPFAHSFVSPPPSTAARLSVSATFFFAFLFFFYYSSPNLFKVCALHHPQPRLA